MESREMSGMVSRQFNLIEIQLEYIQRRRTSLFKGNLGVTVRSFRSTVTMKRPRWTVSENIMAVGSGSTVWMISRR